MTTTAYISSRLFDGHRWWSDHAVIATDGRIDALCPVSNVPQGIERVDFSDGMMCPGFVDLQVNGGDGVMFNDAPNLATVKRIAAAHATLGATSILPTLITDDFDHTRAALEAVDQAVTEDVAGVLGIHLEGPHLSIARKGAHAAKYIRPLSEADMDILIHYAARLPVLKMTVAPENITVAQAKDLIASGVTLSLGHSDASWAQAQRLIDVGVHCATHVFNAMSPMQNREPGVTGAVLADPRVSAGIIADGFHVHEAMLRIGFAAKRGQGGKLFLVSDAMATAGSDISEFTLNGRVISRLDGRLTLADGTLAGADLTLPQAVRFLVERLEFDWGAALACATAHPASVIKLNDVVGTIAPSARADFVHFSPTGRLVHVVSRGRALTPRET